MSETQASALLARQDFGAVTVLRIQEPMLRADETTEALFDQTNALVDDAGRARLVLNLAVVVYLASKALGRLVTLLRKARSAGGGVALCRVPRSIEEMLRITHLGDLLLVYGDEQEAVRSFAAEADRSPSRGSAGPALPAAAPRTGGTGGTAPGPFPPQR
jgi:anti-sigma B factor antagonist